MVTPIIILALLSTPLLLAFCITRFNGRELNVAKYASWGLGIAFLFFALGHFIKSQGMVEMLPDWVPFRLALVYLTGILELIVGLALFLQRYQVKAAQSAIVILILFFPVNIYAALNSIGLGGHQWGPIYLLIRAPLQIIVIAWAYYLCIKKSPANYL